MVPAIQNTIINLYKNEEYSRIMPGMKDFVPVKKIDGSREHVQKRLIICNLLELYVAFQKENPSVKVSLSKFSQL